VGYTVYLAEEGDVGFKLPISPEQVDVDWGSDHYVTSVINIGEVSIPRLPKLRRFKLSSFWPRKWYPFLTSGEVFQPDWYFDLIERWRKDKKVLQFIVDGDMRQNVSVIIDGFRFTETPGYEGEPKYELSLIENKYIAPKKVQVKKEAIVSSPQEKQLKRPAPEKPQMYTLKKGDTLWAIAKRVYGDGSKWRIIAKANNISDAETRRLQIGRTLVIPDG